MLTKAGDKPRISYFNNNNDDVIRKVLKIQKKYTEKYFENCKFFHSFGPQHFIPAYYNPITVLNTGNSGKLNK